MAPLNKDMGDLVVKALVYNILLAKNGCIFNAIVMSVHTSYSYPED